MSKLDHFHQEPILVSEELNVDSLKNASQMKALIEGLSIQFLIQNEVIPLCEKESCIFVAATKYQLKIFQELYVYFQKKVVFIKANKEQIKQCFNEISEKKVVIKKDAFESEDFFYELLQKATLLNASDIHIQPKDDHFIVRFRIDGVMHDHADGKSTFFQRLISHIKILAKLDIAEHRLPQDGRIRMEIDHHAVDLRVSVLPVYGGERVVLRILDQSKTLLNLSQLMLGSIESEFKKMINKSEGILLVTGPTGSGKTTTLYSVLDYLNSKDINIMTIEDPIEYRIDGINQLGVRPKIELDFARGLRHILRQDPDVILIGEIRDKETAKIAIQASLTGHLVLSTLHTNDAASAITRLVEMGIERYLLSSSLIGVLAQRLVRLICPHCKVSYPPSVQELAELKLNEALIYEGKGCEKCFQSGYFGRMAIFELFNIDDVLRGKIQENIDSNELSKLALSRGMQSLKTAGSKLVRAGITSSFEVMRVLG